MGSPLQICEQDSSEGLPPPQVALAGIGTAVTVKGASIVSVSFSPSLKVSVNEYTSFQVPRQDVGSLVGMVVTWPPTQPEPMYSVPATCQPWVAPLLTLVPQASYSASSCSLVFGTSVEDFRLAS